MKDETFGFSGALACLSIMPNSGYRATILGAIRMDPRHQPRG